MTSVGRKLDYCVNNGGGPWLYKLNGELIHRAGSLLPPEEGNNDPVYSQLQVIDTEEALQVHMHNQHNRLLDLGTLCSLQDMLYHHHPEVPLYKHAYELTCNMPRENQCRILFHFNAAQIGDGIIVTTTIAALAATLALDTQAAAPHIMGAMGERQG